MDVAEALLESWDRQVRIFDSVTGLIDDSNRHLKPSEESWPLDAQLAHVHMVRKEWLGHLSPSRAGALANTLEQDWETPIPDLPEIKRQLALSASGVREAMVEALANGTQAVGGYDHPVLFLQHMVWHEGWHVGLIFTALRLAGQEPSDEWQEGHVWGQWRVE